MKYIAVFLILNVLLLSSVSGIANIHHVTAYSCKAKTHNDCCQHKKGSDNDCAKTNCNIMMPCGACEFIIVPSEYFSPSVVDLPKQLAHPFSIGEISDYYGNDWNPPKA
jgi:hypothetical protein